MFELADRAPSKVYRLLKAILKLTYSLNRLTDMTSKFRGSHKVENVTQCLIASPLRRRRVQLMQFI